jgi:sugar-specific transcriptional regulator TrmB
MEELDLSDFITTKSQAVDFSARLSSISEMIYETDFDLEKNLQEQFGIQKKDAFLSLLRKNEIPPGSNSALNNFFGKIQETISSLPTAIIVLAVEPKSEILKTISDWFLLNLKQQILIEIQIDPKIIAGAAVNYQGKRLDASIKSIFNEVCIASLNDKNQ